MDVADEDEDATMNDADADGDAADGDDGHDLALQAFLAPPPGRTESVPFATFCDLLEALTDEYRHARRVEILRDFREKYLTVRVFWGKFSPPFFLLFFFTVWACCTRSRRSCSKKGGRGSGRGKGRGSTPRRR